MKLVKLNRRYKAFKEYGHNWAFRFNGYDPGVIMKVERIFHNMHGSQYTYRGPTQWRACFGSPSKYGPRPYWVSFKNESDATVVLLALEN